jgi:hypothetical protein
MALSATSKNQLNALLALLIDDSASLHILSAAERRLSPANQAHVKPLLARNLNGTAVASTTLDALLADIAAN